MLGTTASFVVVLRKLLLSATMNRQPLPNAPRRANDELEDYTIEERKTLDSIERRHTMNLPLKATYTSLTGPESFRELVQNWYEPFLLPVFI